MASANCVLFLRSRTRRRCPHGRPSSTPVTTKVRCDSYCHRKCNEAVRERQRVRFANDGTHDCRGETGSVSAVRLHGPVSDIADPEKHSFDASVTRRWPWLWPALGVCLGAIAFAVSLVGTELLRLESLRVFAVLLLVGAGMLAVLAWSDSQWSPAFPAARGTGSATSNFSIWRRRASLTLLAGAVPLLALSHVTFLTTPRATFGAAGWLWVAAIALVMAAAALQSSAESPRNGGAAGALAWSWGEVTIVASIAVAGASIMAFSATNVHYSRMALSNITTPFFWVVCFYFLIRGLRNRRSADWTLAGLAAGISEHFYYGTRLLPFILMTFVVYLSIVHWSEAKQYITQVGWLVVGYLIGFGPLLTYFVTHPG